MSDDERPNPDALLASIQRDSERARRGRLKIFFGVCPGVGKTYTMLKAAQAQHEVQIRRRLRRVAATQTDGISDEMPGRGLEPLILSEPDPKSGASANFATPASLKITNTLRVEQFVQG